MNCGDDAGNSRSFLMISFVGIMKVVALRGGYPGTWTQQRNAYNLMLVPNLGPRSDPNQPQSGHSGPLNPQPGDQSWANYRPITGLFSPQIHRSNGGHLYRYTGLGTSRASTIPLPCPMLHE